MENGDSDDDYCRICGKILDKGMLCDDCRNKFEEWKKLKGGKNV